MSQPQQPAQPPQQQLQVELSPQLEPTYSNIAFIQHSPSEFIIDFARLLPGVPVAKVGSRVVTTPLHARLLLRALEENIQKYEAQFGAIYVPQQGDALANQLFGGNK